MIVFDLACDRDHRFEAWFGSSADYADQTGRGLVRCPACDSSTISKAVMAPAVPAKGNSSRAVPDLAAIRQKVESECDDVGKGFVTEARRRAEAAANGEAIRGCYGQASVREAIELASEGIAVAPLPFRPRSMTDA